MGVSGVVAQPSWGFSAGTFGELVYGEIDETPFLVTVPIPWGTRATFVHTSEPLQVWPAHRRKARSAVQALLTLWGKSTTGALMVHSTLPIGKGMASSSADMMAALRAVAAFFGRRLTAHDFAQVCASIEPTDGIMFPGVAAFDPVRGQLLERLGPVPAAIIVGVLGHGRVNTENHHRQREPYSPVHQDQLRHAVSLLRRGLKRQHLDLVGEAGRISAEVEWQRHADPTISALMDLAKIESTGVIIAHSGTVRGLLVSASTTRARLRRLEQKLWSVDAGPVYQIPVLEPQEGSLSGARLWYASAGGAGREPLIRP